MYNFHQNDIKVIAGVSAEAPAELIKQYLDNTLKVISLLTEGPLTAGEKKSRQSCKSCLKK